MIPVGVGLHCLIVGPSLFNPAFHPQNVIDSTIQSFAHFLVPLMATDIVFLLLVERAQWSLNQPDHRTFQVCRSPSGIENISR